MTHLWLIEIQDSMGQWCVAFDVFGAAEVYTDEDAADRCREHLETRWESVRVREFHAVPLMSVAT